jgi:hypothetical protein
MISFPQAREIAEDIIRSQLYRTDDKLIIVDSQIIEKPYAWIFPYTSKRWLEGDFNYAISGNGPLFIDKRDGRISTFRTGLSVEGMIDAYEEQNKTWSLRISTAIYSDVEKLHALKAHLNLEQKEIAKLKSKNIDVACAGSRTMLNKLAALLGTCEITSEIVLTDADLL